MSSVTLIYCKLLKEASATIQAEIEYYVQDKLKQFFDFTYKDRGFLKMILFLAKLW